MEVNCSTSVIKKEFPHNLLHLLTKYIKRISIKSQEFTVNIRGFAQ